MPDNNISSNDPAFDAKLDTLDDSLQPLDEKPADKPEEKPTPEETPEQGKEEDEPKQAKESDKKADDEPAKDEEGYSIDEGEKDETKTEEKPTETDTKPATVSPEDQYILDGLTKFTVTGKLNGKETSYDVYTIAQLPVGFEYDNMAMALRADNLNELKADKLKTEYQQQTTQKAQADFKEREDTADRSDIGQLQKSGDIPKFKVAVDDPKFTEDSAAKLIQEVLDFKEQTNTKYMDEFNAGRPYKHIGFEEAFRLYQRANPTDAAQKKEDDDREAFAKRTSGGRSTSQPAEKPRVHSGMTSRDLDNLIDGLDWS